MMSAAAAQPQVAAPVDLVALRQRWSDARAREVELKAQEEQVLLALLSVLMQFTSRYPVHVHW